MANGAQMFWFQVSFLLTHREVIGEFHPTTKTFEDGANASISEWLIGSTGCSGWGTSGPALPGSYHPPHKQLFSRCLCLSSTSGSLHVSAAPLSGMAVFACHYFLASLDLGSLGPLPLWECSLCLQLPWFNLGPVPTPCLQLLH